MCGAGHLEVLGKGRGHEVLYALVIHQRDCIRRVGVCRVPCSARLVARARSPRELFLSPFHGVAVCLQALHLKRSRTRVGVSLAMLLG